MGTTRILKDSKKDTMTIRKGEGETFKAKKCNGELYRVLKEAEAVGDYHEVGDTIISQDDILKKVTEYVYDIKKAGVQYYMYALEWEGRVYTFVATLHAVVHYFSTLYKLNNKTTTVNVAWRGSNDMLDFMAQYFKLYKIFDKAELDDLREYYQSQKKYEKKVNNGHVMEVLLFGHTMDYVLANKSKIDGQITLEGKIVNVQLKTSVINYDKNNKPSYGWSTTIAGFKHSDL